MMKKVQITRRELALLKADPRLSNIEKILIGIRISEGSWVVVDDTDEVHPQQSAPDPTPPREVPAMPKKAPVPLHRAAAEDIQNEMRAALGMPNLPVIEVAVRNGRWIIVDDPPANLPSIEKEDL